MKLIIVFFLAIAVFVVTQPLGYKGFGGSALNNLGKKQALSTGSHLSETGISHAARGTAAQAEQAAAQHEALRQAAHQYGTKAVNAMNVNQAYSNTAMHQKGLNQQQYKGSASKNSYAYGDQALRHLQQQALAAHQHQGAKGYETKGSNYGAVNQGVGYNNMAVYAAPMAVAAPVVKGGYAAPYKGGYAAPFKGGYAPPVYWVF
jgi:hypothetical protein